MIWIYEVFYPAPLGVDIFSDTSKCDLCGAEGGIWRIRWLGLYDNLGEFTCEDCEAKLNSAITRFRLNYNPGRVWTEASY